MDSLKMWAWKPLSLGILKVEVERDQQDRWIVDLGFRQGSSGQGRTSGLVCLLITTITKFTHYKKIFSNCVNLIHTSIAAFCNGQGKNLVSCKNCKLKQNHLCGIKCKTRSRMKQMVVIYCRCIK